MTKITIQSAAIVNLVAYLLVLCLNYPVILPLIRLWPKRLWRLLNLCPRVSEVCPRQWMVKDYFKSKFSIGVGKDPLINKKSKDLWHI